MNTKDLVTAVMNKNKIEFDEKFGEIMTAKLGLALESKFALESEEAEDLDEDAGDEVEVDLDEDEAETE